MAFEATRPLSYMRLEELHDFFEAKKKGGGAFPSAGLLREPSFRYRPLCRGEVRRV